MLENNKKKMFLLINNRYYLWIKCMYFLSEIKNYFGYWKYYLLICYINLVFVVL